MHLFQQILLLNHFLNFDEFFYMLIIIFHQQSFQLVQIFLEEIFSSFSVSETIFSNSFFFLRKFLFFHYIFSVACFDSFKNSILAIVSLIFLFANSISKFWNSISLLRESYSLLFLILPSCCYIFLLILQIL